jgi:hypothetical protein
MPVSSQYRMVNLFWAVVFLLVCTVAPAAAHAVSAKPSGSVAETSVETSLTGTHADVSFAKKLLNAVLDFQQLGLTDQKRAISSFGSPRAVRQFDQFNKSIFFMTDEASSWSYFFNTSVFVFGSSHPPRQVVAFYHPWSDVFLLMDWEEKNGRFLIADAEFIVGDWIRHGNPTSITPAPPWLQSAGFGPLSLGISVGQSIAAFENVFLKQSGKGFREAVASLKKAGLVGEPNYRLAASRLFYFMSKIEKLGEAQEEDRELNALWSETYRFAEQAAGGDWDGIFKTADKTLPTTKYFLKKLSPETFRDVVIADYYVREEGWLVFLVPVFDTGYCFSFSFEPDEKNRMRMKRIDFIGYSTFYENYMKRAKKS